MKYADIKHCDVANGTGVRTSLFVSGCTHRCRGCFNEIAWDFNYGKEFTDEAVQEILDSCGKSYISGLSLLGGEPMEPQNQRALLPLVLRFKEQYPEKTIWCYTGYLYDVDLIPGGKVYTPFTEEMLSCIDVLVDGEFVEALKDISLAFRGSSNQRILHLQEIRKQA